VQLQFNPPQGELAEFDLSPDGRFLALATMRGSTSVNVWVRRLDSLETRSVIESEGLTFSHFFWSRDGDSIAFQSRGKLYRVARSGGPPVLMADAPARLTGGVWFEDGAILFATADGLFRLPSSGRVPVKMDDQGADELQWLPDRHFLLVRNDAIFVGSLDGGKPTPLLTGATSPKYVSPVAPRAPGHVLFIRGGKLLAQEIQPGKLTLAGDPMPIADLEHRAYTASLNGILVLSGGSLPDVVLAWLDRIGQRVQDVSKPFRIASDPAIRLSPDDSRALVPVLGPDGVDQWIVDLTSGKFVRFTFEGCSSAVWSPDGRKVLWAAKDGKRFLRNADGSGTDELMYNGHKGYYVEDWSSDGKFIVFVDPGLKSPFDAWLVPAVSGARPYLYLQSAFASYWHQISPNSRWMAYTSGQDPNPEQVYVESIPTGKGRWQISTEHGDWPIWRRDGKELFYVEGSTLNAVPVRMTDTTFESGEPQALFPVSRSELNRYQVSRDGQRFLVALPVDGSSVAIPLTVDTDWRAGLMK
jgi:eukaryotic-like serine/threonine-protein kinase